MNDAGLSQEPVAPLLLLTDLLVSEVVSSRGARLGRLRDLTARLDGPDPVVTGAWLGRGAGRYVPWNDVAEVGRRRLSLRTQASPGASGSAQGDLRLARDVLDSQIVDVRGRRLVRVGDLGLLEDGGRLRVIAVEVGWGSLLRRLGLRWPARRVRPRWVDWADLHLTSRGGQPSSSPPDRPPCTGWTAPSSPRSLRGCHQPTPRRSSAPSTRASPRPR